jgi:hypothetical protein
VSGAEPFERLEEQAEMFGGDAGARVRHGDAEGAFEA